MPGAAVFGGHIWDLKYGISARVCIERATGSLSGLANELLGKVQPGGLAAALPEDQAALLICAGQVWREPKLTPAKVGARLARMTEIERQLLTTWAAADFLTAYLSLVAREVGKLIPEADADEQ